jgi:glutamate-ammonia-ligase adenylyltransferase
MTSRSEIKDLLLAARMDRDAVRARLAPYGFQDPQKADANLQNMASDPSDRQALADILGDLLACLAQSADPDQALTYLERFSRAALNKTQLFSYLRQAPLTMEILAKALAASPYMAEILIRDPQHFYWLTDPQILHSPRDKRAVQRELARTLRLLKDESSQLDYLRTVKRREMLHIGVRDLLRLCSVEETLAALSSLAETLISMTYWISASALRRENGIPKNAFTGFTILGMGKLGGGELNFSSDVDLIYLCQRERPQAASMNSDAYFRRLAQKVTAGLNAFTSEGYVYRVDLRLRPEGEAGDLVYTLDGFERYYRSRIATWERLALLKAWPVGGRRSLGRDFLDMARPFVFDAAFNAKALDDVRSMKGKINRRMILRDQRNRNVKLGAGGIREIELITQSLQLRHGTRLPAVCERNTVRALAALCAHSIISQEECDILTRCYLFLRDIENKLQMANDAQTHSLPRDEQELRVVGRTLGYAGADDFERDYRRRTEEVNEIFERRFLEPT